MADLPENYETDEGTLSRREKLGEDVFVLVKEYISSSDLRQRPLLVMTPASRMTFPLKTNSPGAVA